MNVSFNNGIPDDSVDLEEEQKSDQQAIADNEDLTSWETEEQNDKLITLNSTIVAKTKTRLNNILWLIIHVI